MLPNGAGWAAPAHAPKVRTKVGDPPLLELICLIRSPRLRPRAYHNISMLRRAPPEPGAAPPLLHHLPEEILRAIMSQLTGNDAVKLASLHSALRRALRTLPCLQPSVALDVSTVCGGHRTRGATAAEQARCSDSFGAFRAVHPGVAIDAVTVRLLLPAMLPQLVTRSVAAFDHRKPAPAVIEAAARRDQHVHGQTGTEDCTTVLETVAQSHGMHRPCAGADFPPDQPLPCGCM